MENGGTERPWDHREKWFLILCGAFFLASVAFNLNGSSVFIWKAQLKDTGDFGGLLLSTPKMVRSDEWEVWTPAVLSQALHGFPSENPSLGAGKAPLVYSLPVRHYTMWFRPQLYGFFLFDVERGYAWYWNTKVFGLLVSMFLLLRLLTGCFALSLFGSLWIFFSNYVQWWFSCPPMLPEMLTCWALALGAAVQVVRARRWTVRIAAACLFIIPAIDFILCLYPPFQIPLFYLGTFLFAAFLFQQRLELGRNTWLGAACLGAAVFATLLLLVPFFHECRPTFEILSATSYPGHRRTHGGGLTWMQLFSGLMDFFNSETIYPEWFHEPNSAANFYPFWIPALGFTVRDLFRHPRRHAAALAVLGLLLVFTVYAVCPLPAWFCDATLLSYGTELRVLLAIGLANILFVLLTFPILRERLAMIKKRTLWLVLAVFAVAIGFYLWRAVPANPRFLTPWRLGLLGTINLAVLAAFIIAPAWVFQLGFIGLLACDTAFINPLMCGLDPLLKATPRAAIRALVQRDPEAGWAVYQNNLLSEFLMSAGAKVVTGVKIVPDLAFYQQLDPAGRYRDFYNQYAFSCFLLPPERDAVAIFHPVFPLLLVFVHPANPVLRTSSIRYFVFSQPVDDPVAPSLQLLSAFPQNEIWIYQLRPEPGIPLR